VEEKTTPTRMDVRRDIAVLLKTDIDKVWVRRLKTKTGTHRNVGLVHVYDDAAKAVKAEPAYVVKRNQPPEKKAEGEAEAAGPEEKGKEK
jgi:ribosomal protein S24E